VATKRVSKNLQQGRSGRKGTEYRGDNTSQKETRYNLDPESFFANRFFGAGDRMGSQSMRLCRSYIEFKRPTDRDEAFLEVKEAETNEQHKSIISAL